MDRIIRVNSRTGEIKEQIATPEELRIGGRHYIAHILTNEVPPTCEPLGRHNKLIISMGLFADTGVSTTGQISIGGKSPLTGGVKESNSGGYAGKRITGLGIKSIIIEDLPDSGTEMTRVLYLSGDRMELISMSELKHKYVSETFSILRKSFGEKKGLICIGPAGEMKMYAAGVASVDDEGIQIRYAARGGLGALMGSKGIKAIVVDDDKHVKSKFFDSELLKETSRGITKALLEDPKSKNRKLYGTLDILDMANNIGILPTRNFSVGSYMPAKEWTGPKFHELVKKRGGCGRSGTPCVQGCTIQCSNVFPYENGNKIVGSIQYESIALLGSNLDLPNLDDVGELNHLCNEVGVDTIEIGAALGIAMEAGVREFGDAEAAKDMIRQIGQGTDLGRILGQGATFTGQAFGNRRVPTAKGQAMPAYDPRSLKGNGVTYVTSTMGADHTAGNTFETVKNVDPLSIAKHVANARQLQVRAAILDTMGVCLFTRPAFVAFPDLLTNLFYAKFGWELTFADVRMLGAHVVELERAFNEKAGVSEKYRPMPEFMREEPLPPNNTVFDISEEEMQGIWDIPVRLDVF
ncbi:MAG TPA: aldehyde ferredoxin oxidoreductase C-terminal domain-containing protein [Desulfosporosinus sp.]|nr:aldehyde ferredoxin oxidoreductase C-terminal domain-containing protein [Desulfosporosinus sp.]